MPTPASAGAPNRSLTRLPRCAHCWRSPAMTAWSSIPLKLNAAAPLTPSTPCAPCRRTRAMSGCWAPISWPISAPGVTGATSPAWLTWRWPPAPGPR
ncbi:hypothetical protein G6F32_015564 [Rhizopus arrhizus]|nr:hypothetical protein G6F32_015564 [Rhizopus arrhizus]